MLLGVFITIYIINLALQVFIPYIVRETIIFGVTVPEQNVKHPTLRNMKKHYAQIVGIFGIVFLIVMIVGFSFVQSTFIQGNLLLGCFFLLCLR